MFTSLFQWLSTAFKRRMVYQQTRYELAYLSDRDLADLGINRCDIDFIARNHAFKVK